MRDGGLESQLDNLPNIYISDNHKQEVQRLMASRAINADDLKELLEAVGLDRKI